MRDCKGIKILLAICPSSQRSEDFLPQPDVLWNLRVSCVCFLLSLLQPSQFPARCASCHFCCTGFSSCLASTVEDFAELGSCCCWPPSCGGQAEVVSARLNLSHGTIGVGEFVISSLLSHHNKNLKQWMDQHYSSWMDQCHSSILQLSFIQKVKENTSSRYEGMLTQKTQREERPLAQFWLFFLCFFSYPWASPM